MSILFEHVIRNDIKQVKVELSHSSLKKHVKALCIVYAAALGHVEMVDMLLKKGIPFNTFDVLSDFTRTWESRLLKKLQKKIETDMKLYTRGWSPILTPACVAAFYGHIGVIEVLITHMKDLSEMQFDPYSQSARVYLWDNMPSMNALTCAFFGQKWHIVRMLLTLGVVPTGMTEQYPHFVQFGTQIPDEIIVIIFSYLTNSDL